MYSILNLILAYFYLAYFTIVYLTIQLYNLYNYLQVGGNMLYLYLNDSKIYYDIVWC